MKTSTFSSNKSEYQIQAHTDVQREFVSLDQQDAIERNINKASTSAL